MASSKGAVGLAAPEASQATVHIILTHHAASEGVADDRGTKADCHELRCPQQHVAGALSQCEITHLHMCQA